MSLASTVFQDAIIKVGNDKNFTDFEARVDNYQGFKLFKDGADMLLPKSQVENLKKSYVQPEKIPTLNQISTTIQSTFNSCTISPDGSGSTFVPITYVTTGFDIGITPAINAGNYIDAGEDLAWQMKQGFKNVYAALEADAIAYLESNKSNTNLSPTSLFTGGAFSAGVYTVPDAAKNSFYQKIPTIFQRNVLSGKPVDLANTEAQPNYLFIANQGPGNSQNLAYQTQNIETYRSNFVTTATGMQETHFLLPMGSVGVYNWLPWEARNNQKITEANGWTTVTDPIMGMQWQVYYNYNCVGGQYTQAWAYRAAFAFMHQYSSDVNATSILKYQIANPA
jgi:hypothetical protein